MGPESTGGSAYRSYLLRCWEECAETGTDKFWRFSLEDTRSGQRRGFASLNELLVALKTELAGERTAGLSD